MARPMKGMAGMEAGQIVGKSVVRVDSLQMAAVIVALSHKIQNSVGFCALPRSLHSTSSLAMPMMGIDLGILVTDLPINMNPKIFFPATMLSYTLACISTTWSFNSLKRIRYSRISE